MRSIDDNKILSFFAFLTERGFSLTRDYNKASDKTCAQIYRFSKNAVNYIEYRVVTEKECTLCVCVNGQKKFPSLRRRYGSLTRKIKFLRLFQKNLRDEWYLDAALLQEEFRRTGSFCGVTTE